MQLPRASIRWRTLLLAAAILFVPAAGVVAATADLTDVGYVDQTRLASMRAFNDAGNQITAYKATLDRQFAAQMRRTRNPADQQRIAAEFQGKLADRQRALFGPLFARAQVAIASVASSKNLSVVLDKRIVIVGGQDITQDVMDLLGGVGEPVPPVNTPMPSPIGFVDQNQIDTIPKLKSLNDDFGKFRADQQQQVQAKLRGAKTDQDKAQIYQASQKEILDKQHQLIDPVVDQTRTVISDIAHKRGLLLVVDKSNVIYGGTDITSDVTSALK
jgi:outer membrane protein